MSGRRKLEERIAKKEQEIQELDMKMREARAYIQAMQEAIKLLPREDMREAEATLRAGSAVAEAREAILRAGRPLHISEILKALGREVNRENRSAVSGSLAAYVRREQIFTRPRPNTFGLIELADAGGAPESEEKGQPPPGFGMNRISDDDEIPF